MEEEEVETKWKGQYMGKLGVFAKLCFFEMDFLGQIEVSEVDIYICFFTTRNTKEAKGVLWYLCRFEFQISSLQDFSKKS